MFLKKRITAIILLILITCPELFCQDTGLFDRWNKTDLLIMDVKIPKDNAIDSIDNYVTLANKYFKKTGLKTTTREQWVFPMRGWTSVSYRSAGNDYGDIYFDYFQGGESHNHPAHDIFILDKDSNGVEDSTGKKVEALSMVNGIVFTVLSDWKTGDFGRGGNYIKIYDPESEAMFYYSHLDSIFVKVGQVVKAGDPVAYVGRTGRKAIGGRTHLHIAYYPIYNGYPEPENFIDDLYRAEKKAKK